MAEVRRLPTPNRLAGRLPVPRLSDWEWQTEAACRGLDTSMFYHPENERGPSRVRREQQAKAICARCSVSEQCLSWALQVREPYGIWGGTSVEDRDAILRRRQRRTAAQTA